MLLESTLMLVMQQLTVKASGLLRVLLLLTWHMTTNSAKFNSAAMYNVAR